jgi:hypothetical protein
MSDVFYYDVETVGDPEGESARARAVLEAVGVQSAEELDTPVLEAAFPVVVDTLSSVAFSRAARTEIGIERANVYREKQQARDAASPSDQVD